MDCRGTGGRRDALVLGPAAGTHDNSLPVLGFGGCWGPLRRISTPALASQVAELSRRGGTPTGHLRNFRHPGRDGHIPKLRVTVSLLRVTSTGMTNLAE